MLEKSFLAEETWHWPMQLYRLCPLFWCCGVLCPLGTLLYVGYIFDSLIVGYDVMLWLCDLKICDVTHTDLCLMI